MDNINMLEDCYYRACGYPYYLPARSYVVKNGNYIVVNHDDHLGSFENRRPVLAIGSNMSPIQLIRKFRNLNDDEVLVTRVHLLNFDSVYSAHFSNYGAIPATLYPSLGTEVTLFITWLSADQERHMHTTEMTGNYYQYCELEGICARIENGPMLNKVYVYQSSQGALSVCGKPVPLGEVSAIRRKWPSKLQKEIQTHVHKIICPEKKFDDFVMENIYKNEVRSERGNILRSSAFSSKYEYLKTIHK